MSQNGEGSIIRNLEPLTPDYLPENLPGREEAVEQIVQCLRPALSRRKPLHVWLYGPPGSGKTAAARLAAGKVREKSALPVAYISCWRHRSFYSVLDALITEFRVLRAEEQRTAARLNKLERHLGSDPCIIILDDLDIAPLREREDMVYSLAGIGNAGLVCISMSEKALHELRQRVQARLNPKVVRLDSYTDREIVRMLKDRAKLSLAPGSWDKRALEQIGGLSEGSATLAIEVLRASAYAAEIERDRKIGVSHVAGARSRSLKSAGENLAADLTPHHAALYAIVRKERKIPSRDLQKKYLERCRESKVSPVARRTYTKYLSSLIRAGFVRTVGSNGGSRVFEVNPAVSGCHFHHPEGSHIH